MGPSTPIAPRTRGSGFKLQQKVYSKKIIINLWFGTFFLEKMVANKEQIEFHCCGLFIVGVRGEGTKWGRHR